MNDLHDLPPTLRTALEAELSRGERLIYASRPGIHVGPGELFVAALYLGFAAFWCSISFGVGFLSFAGLLGLAPPATSGKMPMGPWGQAAFTIFTIPFVLIGIGMIIAPFYSYWKSRHAVHAITTERVITVHAKPFQNVSSHSPRAITFVNRQDHRNGTGSLRIGHGTERDSDGDLRALELTWRAVRDPRRAEAAIRDLMKAKP